MLHTFAKDHIAVNMWVNSTIYTISYYILTYQNEYL